MGPIPFAGRSRLSSTGTSPGEEIKIRNANPEGVPIDLILGRVRDDRGKKLGTQTLHELIRRARAQAHGAPARPGRSLADATKVIYAASGV